MNISDLPNTDAVLEELRCEAQKEGRRRFLHWLSRALPFALFVILPLCYAFLGEANHQFGVVEILSVTGVLILGQLSIAFLLENRLAKQARKRQALIAQLGKDVRAVGIMVLMAREPSPGVRSLAFSYLKDALPRLQASDARHFTPEQMNALLDFLSSENNDLILAVLKALEQVGDQRAILPVEILLSLYPPRRVRIGAETCLAFLREHAGDREHAATLLRPSAARDATPETLLRPAGPSTEDRPEQLLRPIE